MTVEEWLGVLGKIKEEGGGKLVVVLERPKTGTFPRPTVSRDKFKQAVRVVISDCKWIPAEQNQGERPG